ncbi:unnamed protein product [Brassica napus]|uniref:(rape) hypothetical protein n=1 Tax=Brassica napus TaxID=3708 RepID=A0A816K8V7_BRANA|nr:unnamed protein product [Brassica napus]
MLCEGEPRSLNCYDFIVDDYGNNSGKKSNLVFFIKVMRNTDIADMKIISDVILRAHREQKHILILAGDKDYLYLIKQLTLGTDIEFMLAVNDVADVRLLNAPCRVLRWSAMVYGRAPFP